MEQNINNLSNNLLHMYNPLFICDSDSLSVADLPNGMYIVTPDNFGSINSVKITVTH